MKETKDSIRSPDEHQTNSDCCVEIVDDLRRLIFENQSLSAQLDFLLSSIKDGCSPAEAKFLRQMNHGFIAKMDERQARIDALLK